uniref:uncharacterized protein LOC124057089 n=1 Tax=Scatophagus argus TaxID=75038 RepID=UPI001ED85D53|nr:uncharacterized protein LOC124057089 [Scatophagus argus]
MLDNLYFSLLRLKKMFRSMSGDEHLSGGQSSPSLPRHGVTSAVLDSQESSWIGLFSVVSRPALTFLHKYLPGRLRTPSVSDKRADWISGDLKCSFVEEENEFLRQLDDIMPHSANHLTYLRCQHDGTAGLLEPKGGSTLPWLTADSLRELGIQSAEEIELNLCHHNQVGYLSSAKTFLSQVWLSPGSSQDIKPTGQKNWVTETVSSPVKSGGAKSRPWWGSFWGGDESSQRGLLSDLSRAEEETLTGRLCPQHLLAESKAPAAETTVVFVQSCGEGWTQGENTGPTDHKEGLANNGGLLTVQNRKGSTANRWLSIGNHLSSSEAAAACSEVALLTPDQDNGYSSLEEEHFQMCQLYMVKAPSEEQPQRETESTGPRKDIKTEMEEGMEEGETTSVQVDVEKGMKEDEEEQEAVPLEGQSAAVSVLTNPQCENKAIAFIMGCPCSDDDSSQSDVESSDDDDDDDDGFDSEGSSDLSDTSDDDEASDSDSEGDSEAERLWNSLCQNVDPYNPRNFTAQLHTRSTPPRSIPTATPPSSTRSTPASSPDLTPLPLSTSSLNASPPSGHDVWEDSTSASEVDEAESLLLWTSFSCSSDPYSPFNFQAPLRTRGPTEAGPRARARAKKASRTPTCSPHQTPASPPEYRKEEAEERLDSGFSEPSTSSSTRSCSTTKKVRFCDDVEEFFASCGEEEEDRRGPWEELARDRCRFLRRCQEVEQSIAYCLQPQHRSLVYHRLTVLYVQHA